MKSIQRELTVGILGGTLVLLLASGTGMAVLIHQRLMEDFDRGLEAKARTLATLVCEENQELEIEYAGEYMPEFESAENPEYFQFRWWNGGLIERSSRLDGHDLPFAPQAAEDTWFTNVQLPDGRPGRAVQILLSPRIEKDDPDGHDDPHETYPTAVRPGPYHIFLSMARSRESVNQQLLSLYLAIGSTHGILLILIGLWVTRSIRKGFRPIRELDAQIRQYTPGAVDFRMELPQAPAEIQSIPLALNSLLDKVGASLARERRFSSDVAHELRTPIAELRTACEVGTKWPDDPKLIRELYTDILSTSLHMERIVSGLLTLALCDSGRAPFSPSVVEVAPLVEACWSRLAREAQQKEIRLVNRIPQALTVKTDRNALEMILYNLLSNAIAYGTPDTEIDCEILSSDGVQHCCIRNQTDLLQPEDLEHITERFWRKQHLAEGEGQHSGLGLAIVKSFADILGIDIQVGLDNGHLFEVRLSFPAAAAC